MNTPVSPRTPHFTRRLDRHLHALRGLARIPNTTAREQEFTRIWSHVSKMQATLLTSRECVEILKNISFAFDQGKHSSWDSRAGRFVYVLARDLKAWERLALPHFPSFSHEDWLTVFNAYHHLRIVPGDKTVAAWQEQTPKLFKDGFKVNELGLLMADFGRLLLNPGPKFADHTYAEILQVPPRRVMAQFPKIMLGCAWLDATARDPAWRRIASHCNKFLSREIDSMGFVDYAQTRDACLWFGFPLPVHRVRAENNTVSGTEVTIAQTFSRLGLNLLPDTATHLTRLDKSTDIALRSENGVTVHVEVDGPNHFIYPQEGNTRELYSGVTLFQQALMRKTYPGVAFIRLPTFNYELLRGRRFNADLPQLLRDLFDEAGRLAAAEKGLAAVLSISRRDQEVRLRRLEPCAPKPKSA